MTKYFRSVGRRLYQHVSQTSLDPGGRLRPLTAVVFMEENGFLLDCKTLEEFRPGQEWRLLEEHPAKPTEYVLLAKWTDPKWGEECIAMFGSDFEAEEYAAANDIGNWKLQLVRLMGG